MACQPERPSRRCTRSRPVPAPVSGPILTRPALRPARWTCLLLALTLIPLAAAASDEDDDELPPLLAHALEPWTGDFDAMVERKLLRVIIPVSLVTYYMDGPDQKGPTFELVQHFEKYLKKTLGKRGRNLSVVVIPGRRDQVIDALVKGTADISAGIITVTEARAKQVDFGPPFRSDVDEVVVTGNGTTAVASLDDLAGIPIHVRRSTSFWGTLERINEERRARGVTPLTVVKADEHLRTEDLLEMVAAGVSPATVADSPIAELFSDALEGLVVQEAVPLAQGRSFAWAYRKGDVKTGEAIAGFFKKARKGTYLGNVILDKYSDDIRWIHNVRAAGEESKLVQVTDLFRTYGERYDFDWLMVAAQAYQESGLDHSVKSPVGAIGIMQVMPSTAKDPAVGIPDIHKLESNIHAGVKYLDVLRDKYFDDAGISELDRELFSFAAYNAGPGNVRKARRRAARLGFDPDVWFDNVEIAMGQAVGREPVIYVRNIFKYYIAYKLTMQEDTAREAKE